MKTISSINLQLSEKGQTESRFFASNESGTALEQLLEYLVEAGFYHEIKVSRTWETGRQIMDRLQGRS